MIIIIIKPSNLFMVKDTDTIECIAVLHAIWKVGLKWRSRIKYLYLHSHSRFRVHTEHSINGAGKINFLSQCLFPEASEVSLDHLFKLRWICIWDCLIDWVWLFWSWWIWNMMTAHRVKLPCTLLFFHFLIAYNEMWQDIFHFQKCLCWNTIVTF